MLLHLELSKWFGEIMLLQSVDGDLIPVRLLEPPEYVMDIEAHTHSAHTPQHSRLATDSDLDADLLTCILVASGPL